METNRILKYGFFVLLAVLVAGAIFAAISKHGYDVELARLRNEVAARDTTIEVQKNTYTKLSFESENLKGLLDLKSQEVADLVKRIEKNNEELLAVNQLAIRWKKAYEGAASAHEEPVPPEPGAPDQRITKVVFAKEFGLYKVSGYTTTAPPTAWVRLEQLEALRLSLALTQDASGAWRSYTTTNDENTSVEIQVSAVNPHVLEPRWYENIQLNATVAGGQMGTGFGALVGIGAAYRIKQFDVGPTVFLAVGDRLDKFVGATVTWRPFQK